MSLFKFNYKHHGTAFSLMLYLLPSPSLLF